VAGGALGRAREGAPPRLVAPIEAAPKLDRRGIGAS
jgi:hypothetical protein